MRAAAHHKAASSPSRPHLPKQATIAFFPWRPLSNEPVRCGLFAGGGRISVGRRSRPVMRSSSPHATRIGVYPSAVGPLWHHPTFAVTHARSRRRTQGRGGDPELRWPCVYGSSGASVVGGLPVRALRNSTMSFCFASSIPSSPTFSWLHCRPLRWSGRNGQSTRGGSPADLA